MNRILLLFSFIFIQAYSQTITLRQNVSAEKYLSIGVFESGLKKIILDIEVFGGQANITFISENGYNLYLQNQSYRTYNPLFLVNSEFETLRISHTVLFQKNFYILIGNVNPEKNISIIGWIKSVPPSTNDILYSVLLVLLIIIALLILVIFVIGYSRTKFSDYL